MQLTKHKDRAWIDCYGFCEPVFPGFLPTLPTTSSPYNAPRSNIERWTDTLCVTDYRYSGDADWSAAFNRCVEVLAARSFIENRGGTIYIPDGDYLVSNEILIQTNFVAIKGQSSSGTRIQRNQDYGYTFRFKGRPDTVIDGKTVSGLLTAPQISNIYLSDVYPGGSMTVSKSPHHICFDYVTEGRFFDIIVDQGAGGVALLGANGFRGSLIKVVSTEGASSGRTGLLVGPTTITPSFQPHGGDIILSNVNIQADLGSGTPHFDDGIRITCVDGFWLSDAHSVSAAYADFRILLTNNFKMLNIYLDNVFLDATTGDGLVIENDTENDQSITPFLDQVQAKLQISTDALGSSGRYGIRKQALSYDCNIEADVQGWKGYPVLWEGGSIDDALDLSVTATASDTSDNYAITVQDPVRMTLRLKSIGGSLGTGSQELIGGLLMKADTTSFPYPDPRSITVLGGRIGDLTAGSPAVKIECGFGLNGGIFHMMGTECSTTSGLINDSTTAKVYCVGCLGILPNEPTNKFFYDTTTGSRSQIAYSIVLKGAYEAVLVEVDVTGVVGGDQAGSYTATYSIASNPSLGATLLNSSSSAPTDNNFFSVVVVPTGTYTANIVVNYVSTDASSYNARLSLFGTASIL